jgi:hypothetical protein
VPSAFADVAALLLLTAPAHNLVVLVVVHFRFARCLSEGLLAGLSAVRPKKAAPTCLAVASAFVALRVVLIVLVVVVVVLRDRGDSIRTIYESGGVRERLHTACSTDMTNRRTTQPRLKQSKSKQPMVQCRCSTFHTKGHANKCPLLKTPQ